MSNIDWKRILISILIGAAVAFLTSFLEGAIEALRGVENNVLGGATAAVIYTLKHV